MPENFSIASIIVDRKLDKPLDYLIPSFLQGKLKKGTRVEVSLRGQICQGTVFSLKTQTNVNHLKPIKTIIDNQEYLNDDLHELATWMSRYYCCSYYHAYKLFIPSFLKKQTHLKQKTYIFLKHSKQKTLEFIESCKSSKQALILTYLLKNNGTCQSKLLTETGTSTSPIESLIKKHLIKKKKLTLNEEEEYFPSSAKQLNDEQKKCLEKILKTRLFKVHLIYGITGSGKTEVYLQAIDTILKENKSVLILLPEVALTTQILEKFKARFQQNIAVLHHKRSFGERLDAFEQIKKGQAKIVIGARSAVFAPVTNLGLIVVDEEHDLSFKQSQEAPFYNARDVAIMRAKQWDCPILLGSATPSIESFYNTKKGKYELSTLTKRAESSKLPSIHVVNMKQEFKQMGGFSHFSQILLDKIKERYEKGEQTLLFLNRRGYYSSYLCSNCGKYIKCPHCDLSLTYHKSLNALSCHLCEYTQPFRKNCSICKSSILEYKGFGTEHVEKSLKCLFPEIRILRMDRDTTRKKHDHDTYLKSFRSGKSDVLIGTQMIAKGLHFPSVTLVGILQADSALYIPDFRSSEMVFQLLMQVSGRAGRADLPGEVIIQTFNPDHPVIQKAKQQNYLHFYESEINERIAFGYPPENHLWKLVFTGKNEQKTEKNGQIFKEHLQKIAPPVYHFHPICPCGYAKVKDLFRFQCLIRGKSVYTLNALIKETKGRFPNIEVSVDVDPASIFF